MLFYYFILSLFCTSVKGFDVIALMDTVASLEGESATLLCRSTGYWEYCTWRYVEKAQVCNFEWKYSSGSVVMQACPTLENRVRFNGNYNKNECGIQILSPRLNDSGTWKCEMEEYYWGSLRGNVAFARVDLSVSSKFYSSTISKSTFVETTETNNQITEDEKEEENEMNETKYSVINMNNGSTTRIDMTETEEGEDEEKNKFSNENVSEEILSSNAPYYVTVIVVVVISCALLLICSLVVVIVMVKRRRKQILEFGWSKSRKPRLEPVIPEDAFEYGHENNPEENELDIDMETNTVSYTGSRMIRS